MKTSKKMRSAAMIRRRCQFRLMAFINLSLRLSALAFCNDITAHIAAGIQPISVICRMKQMIAVKIFPRRKKDKLGKKMAIKVMVYR